MTSGLEVYVKRVHAALSEAGYPEAIISVSTEYPVRINSAYFEHQIICENTDVVPLKVLHRAFVLSGQYEEFYHVEAPCWDCWSGSCEGCNVVIACSEGRCSQKSTGHASSEVVR